MSTNFAHKILNADIPPPASAWEKIAAELDKQAATGFVHKVADASIEPPASAWQKIASAIDALPVQGKRISINRGWVKWTAAAVLIGLVAIAAINFFNTGIETNQVNASKVEPEKNTTVPSTQPDTNSTADEITATTLNPNTQLADNVQPSNPRRARSTSGTQPQLRVRHASIESAGMERENLLVAEAEPLVNNNVSTTPANIIHAPDYFVVTAPNGEKVRISSKFSEAVTSLYGGDNVDYLWKLRFDSWKSKLMTNPSFIPSAGNFLDIAELKDMLKEQ